MVAVRPPPVGSAGAFLGFAGEGERVLVLGLDALEDRCWSALTVLDVGLVRVDDVDEALQALRDPAVQVVIASADHGRALTAAVRASREIATAHIVVCAALDAPAELRAALDAGADDVMRVPVRARGTRRARGGRRCVPRACVPTRRCCARSWPTSRAPSTAAPATSTGRCSGSATRSRRSPAIRRASSSTTPCGRSRASSTPTTASRSSAR